MKKLKIFLILILLLSCGLIYLQTDEKDYLIRKKREIEREIELTNKLLEDVRSKQKFSVQELQLIKNNIRKRNLLIEKIEEEIVTLENTLDSNRKKLKEYSAELNKTREEYASLIYFAFKNRNSSLNLMYLLASENINQLYSRFIYLKQYKEYRLKQIQLIIKLKAIIEIKVKELEQEKVEKQSLLNELKSEKATLVKDQESIKSTVGFLKQQEEDLLKKVEEKKSIAKKLEREIEDLIKKEAKRNRYESLTPADKMLSGDFSRNKGKLPWPTEKGVITDHFGEHEHPVMKNIMVRNNGIDISTIRNAKARAIFSGDVSKVFTIKGANTTVIIRHGNFYSVYHNLINVTVHTGDKVFTKEIIGDVYTDVKSGETILHFELWREMEKQNPEVWLSN
jgi:murein hydrolase activator